MAQIERHLLEGYYCDAHLCGAELALPSGPYFTMYNEHPKLAAAAGWSAWVGKRSQRQYCPAHGPRRPEQMRQVW